MRLFGIVFGSGERINVDSGPASNNSRQSGFRGTACRYTAQGGNNIRGTPGFGRSARGVLHRCALPDDSRPIAEKLLANADRGLDTAYFAKDLIDLAIVVTDMTILDEAIAKVHESPKGYDVDAPLRRVIQHFNEHREFRQHCYAQLQISSQRNVADGIDRLAQHLGLPALDRLPAEEAELC